MRRVQSVDHDDFDDGGSKTLDWKKKCQRNLFGHVADNDLDEDCWFLDGNFVSLQVLIFSNPCSRREVLYFS
jgi:hypothetical protein